MANSEQQTNNGQIHGHDHVSLKTIFEILDKLGLNLVTKKFQDEKVDIKVLIPASDEDLIRLGIRTIGDRIRLREAVLPLKSEASPYSTSVLKGKSVHCYKEYSLNALRSHVLSCLSSNYLLSDESDEGSDIVNDHSSIEIRTSSENGEHGDNLQLQSENEEIHSNESPPVREEQQNSVREINIYDEINNIIQYCKEQDFNSPVEIIKYLQENLVQGRSLEIADASQCIDGETNFIMVDRSNLLNTATEEIQHLQNKYLTLEVQFYNEV